MSFLDHFNSHISVDKEAYRIMLRDSDDLRVDKKRLRDEVDELKKALAAERETNTKLINELRSARQPKEVTAEMAARKLGIPVRMLGQIDLERMGVQLPEERR